VGVPYFTLIFRDLPPLPTSKIEVKPWPAGFGSRVNQQQPVLLLAAELVVSVDPAMI
jgi:hypothetical protein